MEGIVPHSSMAGPSGQLAAVNHHEASLVPPVVGLSDTQSMVEYLLNDIQQIQLANDDWSERISRQVDSLSEKMKQEDQKVKERNNEMWIRFTNGYKIASAKIARLEVELKQMTDKCKALQNSLDEKSKSEDVANKQLRETSSKLKEESPKLKETSNPPSEVKQSLQTEENNLTKVQQKLGNKIVVLGALTPTLVSVTEKLKKEKNELKEGDQKYDSVKKNMDILKAELKNSNIRYVLVHDQWQKNCKKIAELEKQLEGVTTKYDRKQAQIKNLREKFSQMEDSVGNLQAEKESLQEEIRNLKTETEVKWQFEKRTQGAISDGITAKTNYHERTDNAESNSELEAKRMRID